MSAVITASQFRGDLVEFKAPTGNAPAINLFPDSSINYWALIANDMINHAQFGDGSLEDVLAQELFIAHNLVLEALDQKDVLVSQIPGLTVGAVAARSAGDVSVSYDTSAAMEPGAGHWNLTRYGMRFWKLVQLFGAGPLHVGPFDFGSGTLMPL